MKVYHYTLGVYIPAIRSSGSLKLTPSKTALGRKEKAVVWFSSLNHFPPTSQKAIIQNGQQRMLSNGEMAISLQGIFRFGMDSDELLPWSIASIELFMPNKLRKALIKRAKTLKEKPSTWWVSLRRVPLDNLRLEKLVNGTWVHTKIGSVKIDENTVKIITH